MAEKNWATVVISPLNKWTVSPPLLTTGDGAPLVDVDHTQPGASRYGMSGMALEGPGAQLRGTAIVT